MKALIALAILLVCVSQLVWADEAKEMSSSSLYPLDGQYVIVYEGQALSMMTKSGVISDLHAAGLQICDRDVSLATLKREIELDKQGYLRRGSAVQKGNVTGATRALVVRTSTIDTAGGKSIDMNLPSRKGSISTHQGAARGYEVKVEIEIIDLSTLEVLDAFSANGSVEDSDWSVSGSNRHGSTYVRQDRKSDGELRLETFRHAFTAAMKLMMARNVKSIVADLPAFTGEITKFSLDNPDNFVFTSSDLFRKGDLLIVFHDKPENLVAVGEVVDEVSKGIYTAKITDRFEVSIKPGYKIQAKGK